MNVLETERNFYKNIKILGEKIFHLKNAEKNIFICKKKKLEERNTPPKKCSEKDKKSELNILLIQGRIYTILLSNGLKEKMAFLILLLVF